MTLKLSDTEHELTIEELLKMQLDQLNIIRMHQEIITGQKIKAEDIDED
jgi:hypothetical protein